MPRFAHGLVALAGLVASLGATEIAHAEPVTYALDSGRLEVLVKYDRNALIAGHDHILVSNGFSGTVVWDADNAAACKIDLTMPVQSLAVDPPGSRARRGLEGETSDGDKKTIKKNALSKGQLNASAHPNITFSGTQCSGSGDSFTVQGNLNIRGTSAPVKASMKVTGDGSALTAKGSFASTHSAFGFQPYTALLGSLRNDESLTFFVDVKGKAK